MRLPRRCAPTGWRPQAALAERAGLRLRAISDLARGFGFRIRYLLDTTLIQYVSPVGSSQRRLLQPVDPDASAEALDPAADDESLAVQAVTLGGSITD